MQSQRRREVSGPQNSDIGIAIALHKVVTVDIIHAISESRVWEGEQIGFSAAKSGVAIPLTFACSCGEITEFEIRGPLGWVVEVGKQGGARKAYKHPCCAPKSCVVDSTRCRGLSPVAPATPNTLKFAIQAVLLLEYRSLVEANSQKAVVTAWEGCACGETIRRWQFKIESARTASLQPDDSRAGKA